MTVRTRLHDAPEVTQPPPDFGARQEQGQGRSIVAELQRRLFLGIPLK